MANAAHILAALALAMAVAVVLLAPEGNANTSGFVLLIQNKDDVDAYFPDGKLRQEIVESINENLDNVPEQLFELFGNNRINIYVRFDDGELHEYYAVTKHNRLVEMRQGLSSQADIEVRLSEQTIDRIVSSEEPFGEFIGAMDSGEIKHEGTNLEGKAKSAAVTISTKILSIVKGVSSFLGFGK